MKISIIIPVYNESKTLGEILDRIKKVDIEKEIIIVDDGSTDGTHEILSRIDDSNIKIFYHRHNLGKGAAIQTGLKHLEGDIVIIQDADLEYNPEEYRKLLLPLVENRSSVVYGSRNLTSNPRSYKTFHWGACVLTFLINILYGAKLTDALTCYKIFKTEVLKNINLESRRFEFDCELTVKLLKKNYSILEIPISYQPRHFEEGKKISWRDGLRSMGVIFKHKFFK